jgi:hypothetical protein
MVAIYSIIFSFRRLYRPGMSIEARKLFQRKHTLYVTLFIVVWTVQLLSTYYHLFNPPPYPKAGTVHVIQPLESVDDLSGLAMFSTGILLALCRLYEPIFVFLIKKVLKMCFGELID